MKRYLAIALLVLAAASCARKGRDYTEIKDKDTVADGGTLVDGESGEASKLNPLLHGDSTSDSVCRLVYGALLRYDRKLELEPDLAESYSFSKDGLALTFKLRKGVKWHDGAPFTSKDVKYTWQMVMDPKTISPQKTAFDMIRDIETPDELTAVVRYKKPYAPALHRWTLGVVPEHLWAKEADVNKSPLNRHPIGTGPFIFTQWKDKQFIELKANPDYWEGKPHIGRYVFKFVPSQGTQLLELKSGGLDWMGLTPDQFKRESDGPDFTRIANKYRFPGQISYSHVAFNMARDMFKDKRVRWALSHAIDRQALIEGVLYGYGQPLTGPFTPVMPSYNHEVPAVAFDLSASAKLLDEAGWKMGKDGVRAREGKPFEFRLIVPQGSDTYQKIALLVQQQFGKAGAKVSIESYEWSTFLSNYVNKKNFDVMVLGWMFDDLDPDQYSLLHSSQTGPEEYNHISYKNAEVDRLLELGRVTVDQQERYKIYKKMHALVAADQPYAYLFVGDSLSALSKKVQGIKPYEIGYTKYWFRDWYIPKSVQ